MIFDTNIERAKMQLTYELCERGAPMIVILVQPGTTTYTVSLWHHWVRLFGGRFFPTVHRLGFSVKSVSYDFLSSLTEIIPP